MQAEVQSANISFQEGAEASIPTTPRRWSLAATSTENDIMRKRVLSYTNSKPTQKMVIEAIRLIGSTEERGASVAAITKWIVGNYAILDMERVKMHIKKAILKALEQGTIQRSATSRGALGVSGSFVLGGKKSKTRTVQKKSKTPAKLTSKQKNEVPET